MSPGFCGALDPPAVSVKKRRGVSLAALPWQVPPGAAEQAAGVACGELKSYDKGTWTLRLPKKEKETAQSLKNCRSQLRFHCCMYMGFIFGGKETQNEPPGKMAPLAGNGF